MKKKVIFTKNYLKYKVGDIALCRSGFIRNFLLPQEKALIANDENLEIFKKKEQELKQHESKKIENFLKIKDRLHEKKVLCQTAFYSDEGKLYGSIKKSKILSLIRDLLDEKEKDLISSENIEDIKIKELGSYDLKISISDQDFFMIKLEVVKYE